jgi:hypothetical protein
MVAGTAAEYKVSFGATCLQRRIGYGERPMERHDEAGVGAELTRLLSGDNRKSRWLLGGMIGTAMVATWLAPRLGWHVSRLRLQLGLAAVWFVILVLVALYESSKPGESGR